MMIKLMVAGIGLILIGLGAIGYGIPVKEFGFGNTLILSGAIASCTGVILLGLHAAVRELTDALSTTGDDRARAPAPPLTAPKRPIAPANEATTDRTSADDDALVVRDRPAPRSPADPAVLGPETAVPPWQQDAARERARQRAAAPAVEPPSLPPPTAPAVEPPSAEPEAPDAAEPLGRGRRSLLFSSSRRERERAALAGNAPPDAPKGLGQPDPQRSAFDEAWPEPGRLRGEGARRLRLSDPIVPERLEAAPAREAVDDAEPPAAPAPQEPAEVSVLKRGEVDGMAYSLYSDGSIEAQMPEGMMRFASIDELRSYLDQRS